MCYRGKTGNLLWGKMVKYPILPRSGLTRGFHFCRLSSMVRKYERKTDRGGWSPESMKNAIYACLNGEMGYKKAASSFEVPQSTLERRVKLAREQNEENNIFTVTANGTIYNSKKNPILAQSLGPIKTVFTVEEENMLFDFLLKMEERLFGLTAYDLRILAFQWAEKLGRNHPFSKTKEIAGLDWLSGFRARHPKLSLRVPEATSAARAAAFNKVNVYKFFDLLTTVVDKHKFTAERIYNCDETGVSIIPKHRSKVFSLKGRKQVGVLTSAERGNTITVEVCYNAAGSYMPPLFVFPRSRANEQLLNDSPPGAEAAYHPSGWMQSEIFFTWFKKFVEWSRPTKDSPILLLLDGHFTHTKNIKVIDHARENGVVLLCFPPHCTHRLQPLDVSFMKPISTFYDHEVSCWLRTNPGRVVTIYQVAKLYGNAFIKAATMETAINGFKKTGAWPVNRGVFNEHDFAPAETTERPNPSTIPTAMDAATTPSTSATTPPTSVTTTPTSVPAVTTISTSLPTSPIPTTSVSSATSTFTSVSIATPTTPTSGTAVITSTCPTPEDIMPIPSCSNLPVRKKPRKHGKTAILTDSPYKEELLSEMAIKKEKEDKKLERAKKRLLNMECSEKNGKINREKKQQKNKKTTGAEKKKKPKQMSIAKNLKRKHSNSSSSEDSDAECIYCGYLYSQSTEGWIQCWKCSKWAHCSCAGEEDEDPEASHLCALCED